MGTPSAPSRGDADRTLSVATGDIAAADHRRDTSPGQALGRYVVIETIGRGGMGEVYRAYDPKLQREVALKRMHLGPDDERGEARTYREAQAIAQLSHPNVIAVYDVESIGGAVVIAMELVEGEPLSAWLAGKPSLAEILRVFVDAGRGLAAAHAAGLVHRDFKPGNVLVGRDGRVRVVDFGLARTFDPDPSQSGEVLTSSTSGSGRIDDDVTGAGVRVGTPSYMAPEHAEKNIADAASDQYSFCVSLYLAIAGEKPFKGASFAALRRARREPLKHPPAIPRWVFRILERGLSADPQQRWPSMNALLAQLQRDPARTRRRLALGAVIVMGSVGIGLAGAALMGDTPCSSAEANLAGAWDDEIEQSVRNAIASGAVGYAEDTAARVTERLDGYAAAWSEEHERACRATHVDGTQSTELLDARMECLDDRRRHLAALAEVLESADASVTAKAVAAVSELPRIDSCADPAYVRAQVKPPDDPEVARRVDEIRDVLADAAALEAAGRIEPAVTRAEEAFALAEDVDYPPLRTEAALRLGRAAEAAGRYDDAVTQLEAAFFAARASGQDEVRTIAAAHLVIVTGVRQGNPAHAHEWARHARAELEHRPDKVLESTLLAHLAAVLSTQGDRLPEALQHYEDALAMREEVLGPSDPVVAATRNNLATTKYKMGDYRGAAEAFALALESFEASLGPDHPNVAATLNNMGTIHFNLGDFDAAEASFRRAREILVQVYGPEHPHVAAALLNLATIDQQRGDLDAAEEKFREALALRRKTLGNDHSEVAAALHSLAAVLAMGGDDEGAVELLSEARAILERRGEAEHPMMATILAALATSQHHLGQLQDARRLLEQAIALHEKLVGPDHPELATSLNTYGAVLTDLGDPELALTQHDRALETLVKAHGENHPHVAHAHLGRARALLASGRRSEAAAPARRALAIREQAGSNPALIAEAKELVAKTR